MFTLDMFRMLRQEKRRTLRDLHREKSVYVEDRRDVSTQDLLYEAAQDKIPCPADELDDVG